MRVKLARQPDVLKILAASGEETNVLDPANRLSYSEAPHAALSLRRVAVISSIRNYIPKTIRARPGPCNGFPNPVIPPYPANPNRRSACPGGGRRTAALVRSATTAWRPDGPGKWA